MMMDSALSAARGPLHPPLPPMGAASAFFPLHIRPRFSLDVPPRHRGPPHAFFTANQAPNPFLFGRPPQMVILPHREAPQPPPAPQQQRPLPLHSNTPSHDIPYQPQISSSAAQTFGSPSPSRTSSGGGVFTIPSPRGYHHHQHHHLPPSSSPSSSVTSPGGTNTHMGFTSPSPGAGLLGVGLTGGLGGAVFTMEEMDMVLYGYAKSKDGDTRDTRTGNKDTVSGSGTGHAISGLRIGELSYGIDRILGSGGSTHKSQSVSSNNNSSSVPTVDPATLNIPPGLELRQSNFVGTVHYGIFSKKSVIPKGTKFGPFQGKVVNTSEIKTNDDNTHMWEIFEDGKLSHFIDGRGSSGNWLAYVNTARYAQEQNLIATQIGSDIYYESCKDIPQGTELLVWYGETYLQFMGIPVALKEMVNIATEQELERSEGYKCERCGKVFAYEYYRDKHLKYTRCVDQGDRKFPCHLCTRSFEKRDRLRIHILHVHEKHRPHKCSVCAKSFSQSSSLNKHMRVHSGERPYKCVYCSKAFTASSILRTHIRQHSGEKPFKCKHCGKAFASHAAHDSHVRRTHSGLTGSGPAGVVKERASACTICGKSFSQLYELKYHMRTHELDDSGNSSFGDLSVTEKYTDDGEIDVVGGMI